MTAPPRASDARLIGGAPVRSLNPLYRPYGVGRVQKLRDGQAKVEFNPSVFMAPPYRSENKILQVAELERVESPLERAARGQWDEAWRFELKLLAARFLTGNKGGHDLTLDELARFTERFLAGNRRQLQRKDSFVEFIVPDVLKPFNLPERIRAATFDREQAIHRSDAEFLALRHPFVDAMLEHVGSYDFGGLAAVRLIKEPKLAGRSGFLFAFVVRERPKESDEYHFRFEPVFVGADGRIDAEALEAAVSRESADGAKGERAPDPAPAYRGAREHIEKIGGVWDWADDVEFLGLSWVQFQ